jgi:putative oxidoreductase
MTTFTAASVGGTHWRSRRALVARIGLWAIRILLSAQFVVGGVLKLTADASMVGMFDDIGHGQGLRLLVGALEVAGAIGLLISPLVRLAAAGLVMLMAGAVLTNIFALQISPVLPLILGVLAAVVAVVPRRKEADHE